jgi:hypothetical protein
VRGHLLAIEARQRGGRGEGRHERRKLFAIHTRGHKTAFVGAGKAFSKAAGEHTMRDEKSTLMPLAARYVKMTFCS